MRKCPGDPAIPGLFIDPDGRLKWERERPLESVTAKLHELKAMVRVVALGWTIESPEGPCRTWLQ